MFRTRTATLTLAVLALVVGTTASSPAPDPSINGAQAFLGSLRPALREKARVPFSDSDRLAWSYLPGRRRGVNLKEMNDAERRAAHQLLRTALSERGYQKAAGVIELEGILREIEMFGWSRDPGLYWLAIFGEPSSESPWGWRFEGHHLSLNFSSSRGLFACTPAFYGANPARVPGGRPRTGWRLLAAEEDLARRLVSSLSPEQRQRAVVSREAPSDIILSSGRKNPPAIEGLPASEMTAPQRELLSALVAEYVRNVRRDVAETKWKEIEAVRPGDLRFVWAGGILPGQGHYYRIQAPKFAIEYDNTQNRANHIHSVWRDFEDDFGADLLRRHYEESPHHADARRRARQERTAVARSGPGRPRAVRDPAASP